MKDSGAKQGVSIRDMISNLRKKKEAKNSASEAMKHNNVKIDDTR